ncbi:MAG: polysaccharide pyruvyl transferase family protein [Lachnospiraceae bacterium]|nr:polysaccharide pyruvyl transferase family protein [Lachnospiraceae bacterium]
MKEKNTVGVVGIWSGMNYGTQLTFYALYQVLTEENFQVTLLEESSKITVPEETPAPGLFRENPYPAQSFVKANLVQMKEFNEKCDSFVVGSDQLWRYRFFKKLIDVNILSFVSADKRKIAYATSFGEKEFRAPIERTEKMRFFLKRFHKISVREQSGVELCRNTFDVEAEWVLDPVFLCNIRHYSAFAEKSRSIVDEPFVFVYIVHPSEEKRIFVEKIVSCMGKKAVFVRNLHAVDTYDGWTVPFEPDCKIEEWLYYIKNCDRVITDSFHAFCFSVIFNKQILPLFQTVDGSDSAERIFSLTGLLGIEAPETMEHLDVEAYCRGEKDINYDEPNKRLDAERIRCRKWLLDALKTEVTYDKTDLLWDVLRPEIYKVQEMKQLLEEQQKEINRLKYANRNIVLFGAGNILQKHGRTILDNINVCAVVDNNPEKWGASYEGIICTKPETLRTLDNPYVLITVKNEALIKSICTQLENMGIKDVALLSEWLTV